MLTWIQWCWHWIPYPISIAVVILSLLGIIRKECKINTFSTWTPLEARTFCLFFIIDFSFIEPQKVPPNMHHITVWYCKVQIAVIKITTKQKNKRRHEKSENNLILCHRIKITAVHERGGKEFFNQRCGRHTVLWSGCFLYETHSSPVQTKKFALEI